MPILQYFVQSQLILPIDFFLKIIMTKDKQTTKPQFTWHKVDSQLRVRQSDRYLKIPLKPNFIITLNNSTQSFIQTRLHIDIEKSMQYEESIGWNWHKSSSLPIFSLKISVVNNQTGIVMIPPKLQARIYAVKIVQNTFDKDESLYLESIGIKGESQIELIKGCGTFSSLRFCSTSYNNQGVNFHLLVVVYSNENSETPENIVCSVISPPIFVDSRKSARNYQEKKYLSFVELFNPNELQKLFVKGDHKENIQEKKTISNSSEGLYRYLTAPNIRHKVKHPLFLAARFSNAFKIYVNTTSKYFSHKQITLNSVITRLQKKLINQVGTVRKQKRTQNMHQKQFVIDLMIQSTPNEKGKITQMLEYLDCNSIYLSEQGSFIHQDFMDISRLGDISLVYKSEYYSLKKKSENQISTRKSHQLKKEEEQCILQKDIQNQFNQKSLFQKIKPEEDQKFSHSNPPLNQLHNEKKDKDEEKRMQNDLNISSFGMAYKKIKPNEEQYNHHHPHFLSYPLHQSFPQDFIEHHLTLQEQRYQNFMFNFGEMSQNQMVKKEQECISIKVSKKQVVQKIKQMCNQVYQMNKKSILNHLETLKKSNIKWRVRDIEHFILSYSSALMNEIFFRQKLLHHMLLENQILKAKVGVMQQMAITDLQGIKSNIMSMNKFLPQKFIVEKLKQNSLWSEELKTEKKIQELKIKSIEAKAQEIQVPKKEQNSQVISETDKMPQQVQEDEMAQQVFLNEVDGQLSSECRFVSNVFQLESPSVRQ